MSRTIIRDCRVWDGSGDAAFPGHLLIEDGRIRAVARGRREFDETGAEVIEAGGMTLMPGLVEGHGHLSFGSAVAATDLGDLPPEEHTLLTARNAKTLLPPPGASQRGPRIRSRRRKRFIPVGTHGQFLAAR